MSLEIAIAENTRALQALLAHLAALSVASQAAPAVEVEAPAPKARKPKPALEPAAQAEPAPVVEAPAAPPAITRDDLLAVMAKAIRLGKRDEVKALLEKVGAGKVSEVPEDRIAAVVAAVAALLEA